MLYQGRLTETRRARFPFSFVSAALVMMRGYGKHSRALPLSLLLFLITSLQPSSGAGAQHVFFDIHPARFHGAAQSQSSPNGISITNLMNRAVTVTSVKLEGASKVFSLAASCPAQFTLAPGERFEIPVRLIRSKGKGKARLRIIALTPISNGVATVFLKFHYQIN